MKTNHKQENPAPVDAFFRQHADDIPVVFDPAHWEALAATLDAAGSGTPGNELETRRFRKRIGKGWWVSGMLLLSILVAWWAWQTNGSAQAGSASPNFPNTMLNQTQHPSGAHTPMTGAVQNQAPGAPAGIQQDNQQTVENQRTQAPKAAPAPAFSDPQVVVGEEINGMIPAASTADSTALRQTDLPAAKDSTAAQKKLLKRKKHLFW